MVKSLSNIQSNSNLLKFDNSRSLIIANILEKIRFCYGGAADSFQVNKDLYLDTCYDWHFYASKNEIVLDAICDNVLYFYPLDVEDARAEDILKLAKNAITEIFS